MYFFFCLWVKRRPVDEAFSNLKTGAPSCRLRNHARWKIGISEGQLFIYLFFLRWRLVAENQMEIRPTQKNRLLENDNIGFMHFLNF